MSTRYAWSIRNESKVAVAESKKHHTITDLLFHFRSGLRSRDGMTSFSAALGLIRKHGKQLSLAAACALIVTTIPASAQHMLAAPTSTSAASASESVRT